MISEQTTSTIESRVEVNQDGQIVFTVGAVRSPTSVHVFAPAILPRALSLAIAKAAIAAQEGEKQ